MGGQSLRGITGRLQLAQLALLMLTLSFRYAESETSNGLRWDIMESDGRVVRSLTDGKRIITLEYNREEALVQCWATKEGKTSDAISLMFYSAMAEAAALNKQAIEINIKDVINHCKLYIQQVSSGNDTKLLGEMEHISSLREGFDGSKWCGLNPKASNTKMALKREDRCCKKWHECSLKIKAYDYGYTMYNYKPYAVVGCNCTVGLESCLRNLTMSGLAEEILDTQFSSSLPYLKCLVKKREKTNCVKWDNFFNKCVQYEWADYGQLVNLMEYKETAEYKGIADPKLSHGILSTEAASEIMGEATEESATSETTKVDDTKASERMHKEL